MVGCGVSSALCVGMSADNHISVPEALSYPKSLCSKFMAQVELENLKGNEKLETPCLPPLIHPTQIPLVVVEQAHIAPVFKFQRGNLGQVNCSNFRANKINGVFGVGTIQY